MFIGGTKERIYPRDSQFTVPYNISLCIVWHTVDVAHNEADVRRQLLRYTRTPLYPKPFSGWLRIYMRAYVPLKNCRAWLWPPSFFFFVISGISLLGYRYKWSRLYLYVSAMQIRNNVVMNLIIARKYYLRFTLTKDRIIVLEVLYRWKGTWPLEIRIRSIFIINQMCVQYGRGSLPCSIIFALFAFFVGSSRSRFAPPSEFPTGPLFPCDWHLSYAVVYVSIV